MPAVFNNLGLVYLALNDRGHAVNAFREALSRDIDYPQVRQNLDRHEGDRPGNATPLTQEIEPNNTLLLANIIAPGKAVEGEIMPAVDDTDCYKVTSPPAPRDVVQMVVTPRSPKAGADVEDLRRGPEPGGMDQGQGRAGKSDQLHDGSTAELHVVPGGFRLRRFGGALYADGHSAEGVRRVRAERLDLQRARDPIRGGCGANIMDHADTDYYSFETARAGKAKVTIRNRSKTLIPALSTFTPDLRSSGFGPDVRTPGADLEHSFEVAANKKYFVQVWSQGDTAGEYTLKIEQ